MKHRLGPLVKTALCLGGALAYYYYQNYCLQSTHYILESPVYPSQMEGLKIVHLSDLNLPEQRVPFSQLIRKVKKECPGMIALTGNLIHQELAFNPQELKAFASELVAIAPTFMVYGDHEVQSTYSRLMEECLQASGVKMLHDQAITWNYQGDSITIMGLMEKVNRHFLKRDPLKFIRLSKEQEALPKILLAHHPEAFLRYHDQDEKSPDLVLTGHAQGGQIQVPGIGGLYAPNQGYFPSYTEGVYRLPGNRYKGMVISRGIGQPQWGFRLHNRSEMVCVTLVKDWQAFKSRHMK